MTRSKGRSVRKFWSEDYFQIALGILLFAAALRFYNLDDRVLHFDEGQVLYFVHLAIENGEWSYDPVLHGPFMFHAASVIMRRVGDSAELFRILPALLGTATVAAPLFLREELGDRASLLAAALLATSPMMVYYSRFFRSDPALLFFAAVYFVAAIRFLRTGRGWYVAVGGLAAGFAATTKENFPVEIGTVTLILLALQLLKRKGELIDRPLDEGKRLLKALTLRLPWMALAFLLAFAVFLPLYAPRPLDPSFASLWELPFSVLETALDYWSEKSGDHDPYIPYYSVLFLLAEPLIVVTGLYGLYEGGRERRPLLLLLGAWFFSSLAIYSVGTDGRMPWLALYGLFPMTLLAGIGVDRLIWEWRESDVTGSRILLFGMLVLLAGHSFQLVGGNYVWESEPVRIASTDDLASVQGTIMVQYAQPDEGVKEIVDTIHSQARDRYGDDWDSLRIQVVGDEDPMYPMPWYLSRYGDVTHVDRPTASPPIVLIEGEIDPDIEEQLSDYGRVTGYLTPDDRLTLFYEPLDGK